ncbi:MAG: CBS domain-containing protein [Anaerolineae bacterium]
MLVKERMTANPITATVNTTHSEAVELLRRHKIRRLPVLDLCRPPCPPTPT